MDAKSWIQEIRAAGKLMAAGDLAGAESRYRQLLDKGTDNPLHKALALDGLGRAVFEQGRQDEAIEAIEAACCVSGRACRIPPRAAPCRTWGACTLLPDRWKRASP